MASKTKQGDQGVATAVLHYTIKGYTVSLPTTEQVKYDLIIDDGKLHRVQVKSSSAKVNGKYVVQLRTNGANYTTKNNVTYISASNVDLVFVLDGEGKAWEFPATLLDGRSTVSLGRQYGQYLVGQYAGIA